MMDARLLLILRMGDNAIIIAQQNAKWCGHAPTVEEDIALSNIALDLIGQARYWFSLAAQIEDDGRDENSFAFLRDVHEFRNAYLCEQPNGDYAQTLMRQYLFDLWHDNRIKELANSSDQEIAEKAQKFHNEVAYHIRRSRDLVVRLSSGSAESVHRMQQALDYLWASFGSLFEDAKDDDGLAQSGIAPLPSSSKEKILGLLKNDLHAMLDIPEGSYWHKGAVQGIHSENLGHILSDMQFLQRSYPSPEW